MDRATGIRLIFGQPQSGKTTRARTLAKRWPRSLCYDTAGHDYRDGVICCGLAELKAFWRGVYRGRFRLVYRPQGSTRDQRKQTRKIDPEFEAVCELVRDCGDMTFVVDEVDRYAERGEYDDAFADLLRRGEGHYRVDLIVATQIPQGIGRLLTAVTRTFDIFQTAEAGHINYFAGRCAGIDPDDIRRLERYQYIRYEQGADSYWICKDDLNTGGTASTEREYLYERTWHRGTAADRGDVVSQSTLAMHTKDGSAGVSAPRASGDPVDGRNSGSKTDGTGPVSAA